MASCNCPSLSKQEEMLWTFPPPSIHFPILGRHDAYACNGIPNAAFYPLNICKGYDAVSTSSNSVNDPMNKPQQLPKDKILNETTTLIQPSFPPPSIPYKTTNRNLCPFSHSLLHSRLPDAGLPMYIIHHSSYPPISTFTRPILSLLPFSNPRWTFWSSFKMKDRFRLCPFPSLYIAWK